MLKRASESYIDSCQPLNKWLDTFSDMEQALAIEREATRNLHSINEAIARGVSDIQRFYCDAVVLITGGSGYMGKQLLEKLFRSCEIRKAYLLLRPKRGKSVEDRLNNMLKDPAYDYLHQKQPDFKQRIVTVEGEMGILKLGISDENWKDITENVTMIFHVAATVKFDESLKTAVRTNVQGTREVLQLAKECKLLKSIVYVSTAYSNVTQARLGTVIEEQFYPAPVVPDVLIDMVGSMPDEQLIEMTSRLTEGWPNTYAFTKAVAEEVVRTHGSGLPVCIIRPAIVLGAYVEPLPGWIDHHCIYATSGFGLSCIMGLLHVMVCKDDVTANLIPVDYVNNAIIASAKAARERWHEGKKEIMIYNVTNDRSFLWADCMGYFNSVLSKIPSPKIVGDCFTLTVANLYLYYVLTLLLHYIPAVIVDVLTVLAGKRPWLTSMYHRIHKLTQLCRYFTVNNWIFVDKNTQELFHKLSNSDKLIYHFDRTTLKVPKMMTLWALGLRRFVIKDELKGTVTGKRKQLMFKLLSLGILLIYFNVFVWLAKVIFGLF